MHFSTYTALLFSTYSLFFSHFASLSPHFSHSLSPMEGLPQFPNLFGEPLLPTLVPSHLYRHQSPLIIFTNSSNTSSITTWSSSAATILSLNLPLPLHFPGRYPSWPCTSFPHQFKLPPPLSHQHNPPQPPKTTGSGLEFW